MVQKKKIIWVRRVGIIRARCLLLFGARSRFHVTTVRITRNLRRVCNIPCIFVRSYTSVIATGLIIYFVYTVYVNSGLERR